VKGVEKASVFHYTLHPTPHTLLAFFAPLRLCGSLLLLFLPLTLAFAQQRTPLKEKEADRARRTKAVELIVETADAARNIKDLFYRARVQTLAADALWPHDEVRARLIFRNAWEAATAYDKAEQEAEERESGVPSTIQMTEARDGVLAKAAARDSKLAEVFLRDLLTEKNDEKKAEQNQSQAQRRTPWREVSEAGQRRLALAYELLNRNESAQAAEIASPVIAEGASADLITFIILLRDQHETEADTLYERLIARTNTDAQADANDVLLLSAPLISRGLLVVVDAQGALLFRTVPRVNPNHVPFIKQSAVRTFYQVAADILLRPLVPRAGANTTPESIALYLAIGRLLPYFEREATQFVSGLRMKSSTLANDIEAGRRENLNAQFELTSLTPERPGDPLRAQLDQLGRARDAQDRDRIALGIVKKAAGRRLWDRAKRAASEIEDINARHTALSYIAVCQIADLLRAYAEDKEDDFESMAKFVRNADVPPLASAWGLAQAAIIAARKGDKINTAALLDEAQTYAARIPAGTWQRVAAYIVIARMAARVSDLKRVWELAPEIVRAANALEDYAGDEASIDIMANESKAQTDEEVFEPLGIEADVFRLDGFFATIAQLDYEKALTAARSLGKETPRAFAMLSIAKVMLNTGDRRQEAEVRRKG
jgi:hypothetical protein